MARVSRVAGERSRQCPCGGMVAKPGSPGSPGRRTQPIRACSSGCGRTSSSPPGSPPGSPRDPHLGPGRRGDRQAARRLGGRVPRAHRGIDAIDRLMAATATVVGADLLTTDVRHFPMLSGSVRADRPDDSRCDRTVHQRPFGVGPAPRHGQLHPFPRSAYHARESFWTSKTESGPGWRNGRG